MTTKLERAAELARKYELLLNPKQYHVALTGSALYGDANHPSRKDDFDFHIYPHVDDSIQIREEEPHTILSWLPITILRNFGTDYSVIIRETFICKDNETGDRVDFFFWNM